MLLLSYQGGFTTLKLCMMVQEIPALHRNFPDKSQEQILAFLHRYLERSDPTLTNAEVNIVYQESFI